MDGQMEVDPDVEAVRCRACYIEANVWQVGFICSCGNEFDTSDVTAAINDLLATARLLAIIVEHNAAEARRVHREGESSFREWLHGIAEGMGEYLGGLLGSIAGAVARWLFG
jgi:hypothetical protein